VLGARVGTAAVAFAVAAGVLVTVVAVTGVGSGDDANVAAGRGTSVAEGALAAELHAVRVSAVNITGMKRNTLFFI
jgi:hypothetical protein